MPSEITITLPDGTKKTTASGTNISDFVATQIGKGLAKAALAAKVDGVLVDLSRALDHDAKLEVVTPKSAEALELTRHDAAHVVASVVQRLFPGTQVTIGPTIDDGFYYDFAREQPFTPEDLEKIEARPPTTRSRPTTPSCARRSCRPTPSSSSTVKARSSRSRSSRTSSSAAQRRSRSTTTAIGSTSASGRTARRPAASASSSSCASRAPTGGGTLATNAAAHLRHGLLRQEGARRLPRAPRGSQEARPPQARQRARALHVPPVRARRRLLAAEGHGDLPAALRLHAPALALGGLHRGQDAADLQQGRSGRRAATGRSTARTCSSWRARSRRSSQADELPEPHADLRQPAPQLPRAAAAHPRPGRPAPQRSLGHARRPHPRAPVQPGRRAPLLTEAGPRRGNRPLHRARRQGLLGARAQLPGQALDAPRELPRRGGQLGQGRGRARGRAGQAQAGLHLEQGRRRLLRAEDRLRRHRRPRPQVAVRDDPARLRPAAPLRAVATSARTTPSTCRW